MVFLKVRHLSELSKGQVTQLLGVGNIECRSLRLQVDSPTSRFAYTQVDSPTRSELFRLHIEAIRQHKQISIEVQVYLVINIFFVSITILFFTNLSISVSVIYLFYTREDKVVPLSSLLLHDLSYQCLVKSNTYKFPHALARSLRWKKSCVRFQLCARADVNNLIKSCVEKKFRKHSFERLLMSWKTKIIDRLAGKSCQSGSRE